MNKEVRSFNFDIRAQKDEKDGNVVEGLAIVYDTPYDNGLWDEYIDRGALDKCNLKDVRLLVNHNTDMIPLARSRNNTKNSTMQLIQEEDGLRIRAKLDIDNNTDAKKLYSATERGDISGMSFMFTVGEDRWEDLDSEHPVRHITGLRQIIEVSACTFPAYESTTFEARDEMALDSVKSVLDNAKNEHKKKVEEEKRKAKEIEKQKQRIRILANL